MKLNYLLEKCETHKNLEPQFSLHFNDLTETIRELNDHNNEKFEDMSKMTYQSSIGKMSQYGLQEGAPFMGSATQFVNER